MYKLAITKMVPNADYAKQREEYERKNREQYYGPGVAAQCPFEQIAERVLEVEVTDEMFNAIRKACLEAM